MSNARLARWLAVMALAAFGFGFALVPLYDVLCKATGLNGKPADARAAGAPASGIDRTRTVTVDLMGTAMPGAGWDFYPTQRRLALHPGEVVTTTFVVSNPTDTPLVGQAIPSVSPGSAAAYLQKLECFCFRQQRVEPGEVRAMPVTFFLSRDLPARDTAITLSYALFPVSQGQQP